jgi:hypothetical protein
VIHTYEEISLCDPLDALKSIEIALYKLKTDKISNFTPIEQPSIANAVRELAGKDKFFEFKSFKRIDELEARKRVTVPIVFLPTRELMIKMIKAVNKYGESHPGVLMARFGFQLNAL